MCFGRDGEMAQKVMEWDNHTCQHMHLILRWLKIRTIHFSFYFSSNYWSHAFCRSGSLFLARKFWDGSKFEKKLNSISSEKNEKNEWFEFWAISKNKIQIPLVGTGTCHCLLRWLFEPSHHHSCKKYFQMFEMPKMIARKLCLLKTVRPSCRPSMDFPLESIELRCQSRVRSGRFRIDSGLFLNRLNLISNFPKKKFIPLAPAHLPRPRTVRRLNLSKYSTANNWQGMWLNQHVINREMKLKKYFFEKKPLTRPVKSEVKKP